MLFRMGYTYPFNVIAVPDPIWILGIGSEEEAVLCRELEARDCTRLWHQIHKQLWSFQFMCAFIVRLTHCLFSISASLWCNCRCAWSLCTPCSCFQKYKITSFKCLYDVIQCDILITSHYICHLLVIEFILIKWLTTFSAVHGKCIFLFTWLFDS